ncbi:MAG: YfcE family phosphodiesterase [Anaeroplasmataceae bacterium]|nr:YfcE family phosphodiesterase [Anaeroplasmataceae bacterium]MDE6414343.1 YfcE family phosphodiesterase [Anaeroplasmataceae bacterium]
MKILVLSDSHHSSIDNLDFYEYDAVIHCGDYGNSLSTLTKNNVFFVKGNCDAYGEDALFLRIFGKKIFVTHGHMENVKYGLDRLIYKSLENKVQITLFGHTHQQVCFVEEDILFLNPGSYPNGYIEITEDEIKLFCNREVKSVLYRW